ncbi:MAG: cyclase family protein [Rikenellaceae bacterium]|nr:cyclase family protein [Rikenellaceae bacterium]
MKTKCILGFLLAFAVSCTSKQTDVADLLSEGRWVDLTWDFEESTVYWPTNVTFTHDTVAFGINDKGYFYSSFKYAAEEHGGTHFDAPLHFAEGGRSIEQIPVEELTGAGVLVDISAKVGENRDYLIPPGDFRTWESENGKIPEGFIVLIKTGFGKYWGDKLEYTGTTKSGPEGVEELHFPGLSQEAAEWLVKERKIKAVGIDTPSIDYGQSKEFLAHRFLCGNNITAYENLANLEKLPATGFYVVAAPMKIKGGSGSPLRILALIPQK